MFVAASLDTHHWAIPSYPMKTLKEKTFIINLSFQEGPRKWPYKRGIKGKQLILTCLDKAKHPTKIMKMLGKAFTLKHQSWPV